MLEKRLQALILEHLKKEPNTYPMKTMVMNMRGLPDIIICHQGYFCYIEVKNPARPPRPTKLQAHRMQSLEESGAVGFVTNSFEDFLIKWNSIKTNLQSKGGTNGNPTKSHHSS